MRQISLSVSLAQRLRPPEQPSLQVLPVQLSPLQLPDGQAEAGPQVGQLAVVASQTWIWLPVQRLVPTVQEQGISTTGVSVPGASQLTAVRNRRVKSQAEVRLLRRETAKSWVILILFSYIFEQGSGALLSEFRRA